MRKTFFSTIIALTAVISVSEAQTVAQLRSQMSSPTSQVRASALEQFIDHLDPTSQPQQLGEALPVFVEALSDSDSKVREFTATGLLIVAEATMRVEVPARPNFPDPAANPKMQQALSTAMSDADLNVRVAAIQAYAATYKLSPDLEQKIIDTFNSYQPTAGQPDARFDLLGSLVNDRSPSPVAVDFIVQKIDDPKYGITALGSLASLKKPPVEALPKLLSEAAQHDTSKDRRSALVQAVNAYGPSAQAQLERILSNSR
jgi:HEAT repeat protein